MKRFLWLAAILAISPVGNAPAAYYVVDPAKTDAAIEVTNRDVAASNDKVRMAHSALAEMWTQYFRQVGTRFAVPDLVRYRGAAASACGIMKRNNAGYCPATIPSISTRSSSPPRPRPQDDSSEPTGTWQPSVSSRTKWVTQSRSSSVTGRGRFTRWRQPPIVWREPSPKSRRAMDRSSPEMSTRPSSEWQRQAIQLQS